MENQSTLFGHPKGLFILFFTEMWERFSYYGMRAILVLYVTALTTAENSGLGWTKIEALELYGIYTALVYIMSIPGGILADKFLGQKKTVMLGGLLLCIGHAILAITHIYAFYSGLILIILGVGALKPNISTMVGGLYKEGDNRRDMGFSIFYIGINIGAAAASIIVGYIGTVHGWHYGFGLAGIGMVIGQLVYLWGQRFLQGIGSVVKSKSSDEKVASTSLTKIEKDRVIVLLISFLIVIVFWGAFEQAGGLMNLYTKEKVDTMGIPAAIFQALNPIYIIIFGTMIAAFWMWIQRIGKEASSLFKMAIGTMIMGSGFLLMTGASLEAGAEPFGKAVVWWLFGAYLLHTIGELCASPVALSFITKLAPVKYASIMMGCYFAATGFGNLLAGKIGESAQTEPIDILCIATDEELKANFISSGADSIIDSSKALKIYATINRKGDGGYNLVQFKSENNIDSYFKIDEENTNKILDGLATEDFMNIKKLHASFLLERKKGEDNYSGIMVIDEIQNKLEKKTFTFIAIFTVVFGLLLIIFLKKLKALTHGAEDLKE